MTRARAALAGATVLALAGGLAPATATTASAATPAWTVVARGLDGPFGLQPTGRSTFVVAEADTGEITKVDAASGRTRALVRGLPGPASVAVQRGSMYVPLGAAAPDAPPPPRPAAFPEASVLKARADGAGVRRLADLLAHERRANPDRQVQLVGGRPVDALSNPFGVDAGPYGLLVADGGANAVLRVGRLTGRTSTFFVPPTVTIPACRRPGVQANPGTVGCDSVPTDVLTANGSIYVATLGSEVPGAARIYRLDPHDGRVQQVWYGLTGLTGIAVAPDGTIYASSVLEGAPAGPPGPGFDPASVGEIVKIAPNGRRTTAQVPMPLGLAWHEGALYSTAYSVGSFLGLQRAGQLVRVSPSAFR